MRVLHISDLHFGDHNPHLADNLKDRVRAIRPDLILATGDVANHPTTKLLQEARTFLDELAKSCAPPPPQDPTRPPVMVIPGNHDVRYFGNLRLWGTEYRSVFGDFPVHHYFSPDRASHERGVWVYCFDSSLERRTGANGRVSADGLIAFDKAYGSMLNQHQKSFEAAFKIAAIHHHPVPIKYDDSLARWLVLTNAGEFRGEILKRNIDLVIHGHEHIRARARYGRELRVEGSREIPIISVGATLKKNAGERNCFHVIEIDRLGTVRVDYYGADRNLFDAQPSEPYDIISVPQAQEKSFELGKNASGYGYAGVSSITKINKDGDALRIIECHDLQVTDVSKPHAKQHKISIPATSGYLDMWRASVIRGDGLLKFGIAPFKVTVSQTSTGERIEWADTTIDYGRHLAAKEKISYMYSWYAVNSFAMNEREARSKYVQNTSVEFTHYPVLDPIEELTVIVQFPEDFLLQLEGPQPRVAKLGEEASEVLMEAQLREAYALRYYQSLSTVALRVHRPATGYSYGIQWAVPPSPPAPSGANAGLLERIVQRLLHFRAQPTERSSAFSKLFLFTVGDLLRNELIPGSTDQLELSLMVFDQQRRKMVAVGAALIGTALTASEWTDHSNVEFEYGEGIAGKVFKTNDPRLYIKLTGEEAKQRKTPDFYRALARMREHEALLSFPLENPEDVEHVYGVISCGTMSRSCKLYDIGQRGGPVAKEKFGSIQASLNNICFQLLREEFSAGQPT